MIGVASLLDCGNFIGMELTLGQIAIHHNSLDVLIDGAVGEFAFCLWLKGCPYSRCEREHGDLISVSDLREDILESCGVDLAEFRTVSNVELLVHVRPSGVCVARLHCNYDDPFASEAPNDLSLHATLEVVSEIVNLP